MPVPGDEERALLEAYAEATLPSSSEVERALTRTLARIDSEQRSASLPDRRRRVVWVAAAGLATLVIATAAVAGVRWYRAQPQPSGEVYGAARLDREGDEVEASASQRGSLSTPAQVEPADLPEPGPEPIPAPGPEPIPEAGEASELQPAPRPRARSRQPSAAPASDPPAPADASQLAAESRLLSLGRRALRDNDFAAALEFAEQHARQHPGGSLTEERLILEAVAACRGDRHERGLAAARQLREQFPTSSAIAKVEQSCAGQ
ncbi:MAG TPA: hypothetical protein VK034_14300 [Enhygromyxa sp.]|nr:hypothetical protein [Enhygromyxa sp.]